MAESSQLVLKVVETSKKLFQPIFYQKISFVGNEMAHTYFHWLQTTIVKIKSNHYMAFH